MALDSDTGADDQLEEVVAAGQNLYGLIPKPAPDQPPTAEWQTKSPAEVYGFVTNQN